MYIAKPHKKHFLRSFVSRKFIFRVFSVFPFMLTVEWRYKISARINLPKYSQADKDAKEGGPPLPTPPLSFMMFALIFVSRVKATNDGGETDFKNSHACENPTTQGQHANSCSQIMCFCINIIMIFFIMSQYKFVHTISLIETVQVLVLSLHLLNVLAQTFFIASLATFAYSHITTNFTSHINLYVTNKLKKTQWYWRSRFTYNY